MAKNHAGVGPGFPQVVVLFGATGDLSHRKLLPGLFRLTCIGFIPAIRIIGVSLEDMDAEAFRKVARAALDEFSTHKVTDEDWNDQVAVGLRPKTGFSSGATYEATTIAGQTKATYNSVVNATKAALHIK